MVPLEKYPKRQTRSQEKVSGHMLSFKIYLKVLDQAWLPYNELSIFVSLLLTTSTNFKQDIEGKTHSEMHMIFVIIYHGAHLSVSPVLDWITSPVYSRICRLHAVTQLYEAWAISRVFFKFYALIQHDPVKVLATQLSVYRGSKVPVSLLISSSLSEVSQHPQETDGAVILKDTHTRKWLP